MMTGRVHNMAPRRGLTLIELTLAMAITVFIGGGLASVLAMVSQVSTHERDTRTGALRAHAAQIRMHAYVDTALCVLQANDSGEFALWLEDANSSGSVNLTELRVFWVEDDGRVLCERVEIPEDWTPAQTELYDVVLPAATDFFNAMRAQRKARMTSSVVIVDGVTSASIEFDDAVPQSEDRFRFRFTQSFNSGAATESLIALPLANHRAPEL
jgi:type II secretory pathway pseudopilin PulG